MRSVPSPANDNTPARSLTSRSICSESLGPGREATEIQMKRDVQTETQFV